MTSAASRLRVVVSGYIGLLPAGGVAWDYAQYVLALRALGHDARYIEDTRLWPVYGARGTTAPDCSATVRSLAEVMRGFGLEDEWAYRDEITGAWFGADASAVSGWIAGADVLLNVSCATPVRDAYLDIPVRVMIDSDPMFTQIQCHQAEGFTPGDNGMRAAMAVHTHHFTFGERVGAADCRMPETGVDWRPTRQPICLDRWTAPPPDAVDGRSLTTVMNWSAGRPLNFDGETWGQKDVEFLKVLDLPRRCPEVSFSVAIGQTGGADFPAERLRAAGWRVLDPSRVASSVGDYRDFIMRSLGECSVAKQTYVKARTGWFSCRSACYLAAGRPVITQDTGWSHVLPSGEGLLAFDDIAGAADAVDRLLSDPVRHGRRAREIADACFDGRKVIGRLLADVDGTRPTVAGVPRRSHD
ncbi:hypothetical protein TBR22_A06620 [Luteitalea sp. TBR-22]|uniref:glycosyltransferase n=1 Tax=Luteitalea sp. TBR-22 TaxID=2802971 RepID=UPI001AF6E732|nr:hypothetical protein [Luteitalea sp. TBR-22]BCS31461.1 hypothetical protein TBR22_A06620 [Luteitalea sp. TBR-22]